MPVWLVVVAFIVGGGGGVGGTLAFSHHSSSAVVEAVRAPELTEAQARLAVASTPAVNLAIEAAVKPGATRTTVALAAYALCVSGSEAQAQGAAAFDCPGRARALDAALESK